MTMPTQMSAVPPSTMQAIIAPMLARVSEVPLVFAMLGMYYGKHGPSREIEDRLRSSGQ